MSNIYNNLKALQDFQINIARAEIKEREGDDKYSGLSPEDDAFDHGEAEKEAKEDDFMPTKEDLELRD